MTAAAGGSRRGQRGFSFLEIMISVLIAATIFGAVAMAVNSCFLFLKRAENRSRAVCVTQTTLDRFLAKSYSSLDAGSYPSGTETFGDKMEYDWNVTVSDEKESAIPYKKVSVVTRYEEDAGRGTTAVKEIRMANIVPYPYIHDQMYHEMPSAAAAYIDLITSPATNNAVAINYAVAKDLMIIYNISFKIRDSANLVSTDTIYTKCFIDNVGMDVETRTPITSQFLISNVISASNVGPGPHDIKIKWYKDTQKTDPPAGEIALKELNLIIVACEHK